MQGFPPAPDARVTLANWQTPPYNRWAFSHLREIVPTQRIARGDGPVLPLPADPQPVGEVETVRSDRTRTSVDAVLDDTFTDGVVVVQDGRLVYERYLGQTSADTTHLLMSISKSVVSCVAGNLVARGVLAPEQLVTEHIPEMLSSGYRGATVRHLLDMRSGIRFSEEYTDPNAEVRVLEQAARWSPLVTPDLPDSMYPYLTMLVAAREHGGAFEYRSCETDVLGWVCERAAGRRMADLIGELLWAPLGAAQDAEITCDVVGSAMHDGGVCATTADLARFGVMLLDGGRAGDRQVVPEEWLRGRVDAGRRHPRRLRRLHERSGLPRRLVPQPVLVQPAPARRRPDLPGHQRADALRQPGHAHRRREDLVLAGRAGRGDAAGHAGRLRRGGRGADGRRPSRRCSPARPAWPRASRGVARPPEPAAAPWRRPSAGC